MKIRLLQTLQSLILTVPICVQAGNIAFNYDNAGRLTRATFVGSQTINYAYAASGNLMQRQINATANPDSDGDGLNDAWEQLHFGNLLRNGSGDFDNDGFNDLNEFLAGTNPNDAGSALRILPSPTPAGGSVTVEWAAVFGKTYRLQFKNSLSDTNWTDVIGDVTASGSIATKVDASVEPSRFYRVKLVP